MIREVASTRLIDDGKQTLGAWVARNESKIFVCNSLELPWKANLPKVSCIPKGKYLVKYTKSPKLSLAAKKDIFTYEVTGVPNRAGIRLDKCNFSSLLLGCIALGNGTKDLDIDGNLDVIHSGDTIKAFESFMECKDFWLTIK